VAETPPTGVLLAQLGTPDEPTAPAVRRYLAEFLGDRRVVDLPRWLWKPILHLFVLRTRPARSAALYRNIWTPEGSPLLVHSRAQAEGLSARLGPRWRVELGMRIGNPAIGAALDRLQAAGCRRIVVLPLFPQRSFTTTSSMYDAVDAWAARHPGGPALDRIESFAADPGWIRAWVDRVRATGATISAASPLLVSFHGIPQRYADRGDPYPAECRATADALVRALGLPADAWRVVFQSRFGREAWLQPYADEVLRALPGEGIRSVVVAPVSFVSDCLETLDELGRESRHVFTQAGGTSYTLVPCPNASPAALDALEALVRARG
jgi:ferrochelatase